MDYSFQKSVILILFTVFAGAACIVDIKYRRIPDWSVFPGTIIIIILRLAMLHDAPLTITVELLSGALLFMTIRIITRGKLGMGDVKFAGLMGVFLGFPEWFAATTAASVLGLIVAFSGIAAGKLNKNSKIPFAPFLTAGSIGTYIATPLLFQKITGFLK